MPDTAHSSSSPSRADKRRRELLRKSAIFAVLAIGGVSMVLPLLWMLATSLKDPGSIYAYPPEFIPRKQATITDPETGRELGVFIVQHEGRQRRVAHLRNLKGRALVRAVDTGEEFTVPLYTQRGDRSIPSLKPERHLHIRWENYPDAWKALKLDTNWLSFEVPARRFTLFGSTFQTRPFGFRGFPMQYAFAAFYLNSILISLIVTVGQVFTSSLAAYAFARLKFPGRDAIFLAYLGTLMVPFVVTMIPVFAMFNLVHLYDTFAALALPGMFSAYGTFLLRQFFISIPAELEDAAAIDGCSRWQIYRNVIMPLSGPALATLTTFVFLQTWNNFMWPLIMIDSDHRKPLMLGLHTFMGRYSTDWTLLMSASVMVIIPVLLVFILGQRYFVRGIVMTGLKG
ncbi:MAG: carbohydrate ABC transporter permease [Acidobacteriota bacterium]|nr:carbohydrate ABC transporter permease [Acidobacteriota bacterium]